MCRRAPRSTYADVRRQCDLVTAVCRRAPRSVGTGAGGGGFASAILTLTRGARGVIFSPERSPSDRVQSGLDFIIGRIACSRGWSSGEVTRARGSGARKFKRWAAQPQFFDSPPKSPAYLQAANLRGAHDPFAIHKANPRALPQPYSPAWYIGGMATCVARGQQGPQPSLAPRWRPQVGKIRFGHESTNETSIRGGRRIRGRKIVGRRNARLRPHPDATFPKKIRVRVNSASQWPPYFKVRLSQGSSRPPILARHSELILGNNRCAHPIRIRRRGVSSPPP